MTGDQIVDRVRSVCLGPDFSLVEAAHWQSFDYQPSQNDDRVVRVPPMASQRTLGQFGFAEDRTDSLQIWLALRHGGDLDATRRALGQYVHSLTAACVRDAFEQSGDYAVLDEGRGHSIVSDPAKEYVMLRLTLPVNYEAQL